ncbi:MAG: hypothetical protein ACPG4Z_07240 [Chitinophagales bacterium]
MRIHHILFSVILLSLLSCASKKSITSDSLSFDISGKYRVIKGEKDNQIETDADFEQMLKIGFYIELSDYEVTAEKIIDFLSHQKMTQPKVGYFDAPSEERKIVFYWQQKGDFVQVIGKEDVDQFLINSEEDNIDNKGFYLSKEKNEYTFILMTNGKKEGITFIATKEQ